MTSHPDALLSLLEKLFPQPARVMGAIENLLAENRDLALQPGEPRRLDLNERDLLLITYGDQVQIPDRPPLAVLREFCHHHLRDVVSGVHVLPFFPASSDDGFSVMDYFAVAPALGTWDDLAGLGREFDLMIDAVFNHVSAQGEWFRRFCAGDPAFADFFIRAGYEEDWSQVVRPRTSPLLTECEWAGGRGHVWTTFSADQVDLNFRQPQVLCEVLRALLLYVRHGARFIRLDAIAYLWKEPGTACIHLPQTHTVIQILRAALDRIAPHVLLITETNVPHAENISYFGDGHNEAQLVYNFALPPLVLHALLREDARALTRWAQTLTLPSTEVSFLNFLASHDGIGLNPARGILPESEIEFLVETCQRRGGFVGYKRNPDGSQSAYELNVVYWNALAAEDEPPAVRLDRLRVAHAIMLVLQGVPAIYFHSLFGSTNDRDAALSSGIPRRINRAKLRHAELEAELMDRGSLRAAVFALFRELIGVRRMKPAFSPLAAQEVIDLHRQLFVVRRGASGDARSVLTLQNVSSQQLRVDLTPLISASCSSYSTVYGKGVTLAFPHVELQPYGVAWLATEDCLPLRQ